MKTIDVEVAMMQKIGVRANIVVPNVFWGMDLPYEADLVSLSPNNYATEIEIKVSRGDLLKDKKKKHKHDSNLFKYLYFAVPIELKELALSECPKTAGIYTVKEVKANWGSYVNVDRVRSAIINRNCVKWSPEQRCKLASLGCMRILAFKESHLRSLKEETGFKTCNGSTIFSSDISEILKMYSEEKDPYKISLRKGHNCLLDVYGENCITISWSDFDSFNEFIKENKLRLTERPE